MRKKLFVVLDKKINIYTHSFSNTLYSLGRIHLV